MATLQDVLFHHIIKIISIYQYEWYRGYSITYKSNLYKDYAALMQTTVTIQYGTRLPAVISFSRADHAMGLP